MARIVPQFTRQFPLKPGGPGRRHTAVRGQGAKRLCSAHPPCGSSQAQGSRNRHLSICESAERKRTQSALTKEEMKNCTWVRPEVVAHIEFAEWTPDAHLRNASFAGLREDKDPREVVREVES